MSILKQIKVGDRIKFRSWTRYGTKTAVRIVHKVDEHFAYVSYFGINKGFCVKPHEIIEVVKDEVKDKTLKCPSCGYEGEPCDFPDLYYDGLGKEFNEQVDIYNKIVKKGFNITTCGNCGKIVLEKL